MSALAIPSPRTPAQHKVSRAIDVASAHALDLARLLKDCATVDQDQPLKQKARHELAKRAREKLRQIEARLAEVES